MKLKFAGTTHVGVRRKHNEDNLAMVGEQRLYVVADGMGGHACGEVASQIAVDTMGSFYQDSASDRDLTWPCQEDSELSYAENRLQAGIKLANLRIFEMALEDTKYKGMGTTVVVAYFHDSMVSIAHVGDSRVYRFRGGELTQLTEDHSLLNDYKKMTTLTEEEERNFPHKNIIVRALGMKETVDVDVLTETPREGDTYLLCSDGLNGELEDPEIEAILAEYPDLEDACTELIKGACEKGGKDNVTVVLVRVAA